MNEICYSFWVVTGTQYSAYGLGNPEDSSCMYTFLLVDLG